METRPHGDPRGDRWLLVTMAACGMLLGVLLWQSVESTRDHVTMARQVLSDYAELAAANYARALKRGIGYQVVYQLGQAIGRDPDQVVQRLADARLAATEEPMLRAALETVGGVGYWAPDGAFDCLQGDCAGFGTIPLAEQVTWEVPPEGFVVVHRTAPGGIETAALYPADNGGWIGNVLYPRQLQEWCRKIAAAADLLPPALVTDGAAVRPGLQLVAPGGDVFFEAGWPPVPPLTGTAIVDGDYGGLFEGFAVRAGLEPALAPDLIIGGLPGSRLPVLILLAVLTLILILAVFRLLWRERQLVRLRSDFVARVSHELRTPLTQIRMFAETLLLARESDAQTSRLYLRIIDREARRLGHLVDNVLTFSGKGTVAGRLVLEPRSLAPLLEDIVAAFQPIAAGAGSRVDLKTSGDLVVRIDDEAFRQVLLNLLDNACKYGPEDQTIRVEAERHGERVWVRVCDQGPGIPAADRERVWQPFERLSRDDRRARHGTGIGLAVSGELLAAMGAQYSVRTGEGGGTVVEMVLVAEESTDVVSHTAG